MSIPPHPNFGRLQLFVQGHLELAGALAATDGPRSAAARLDAWAGRLNSELCALGADAPASPHLHGLSAFDLAEARDRLSAAAGRYRDGLAAGAVAS